MVTEILRDYVEPRAWLGCSACYSEGKLVGDWFDASDADTITPEQLHDRPTSHDEIEVMDHEHLPVSGEPSLQEAAAWGRLIESVDQHLRAAFLAWISTGMHVTGGDDLPSVDHFIDAYQGEWASFREFSDHQVAATGMLDSVPDEVARYFDWDQWERDLAMDYTVERSPSGETYVFHNL